MKCSSCPVGGGTPCPGTSPGRRGYPVPRFCELAAMGTRHHSLILKDAGRAAVAPPPIPRIERPRVNIREQLAIVAECDYRGAVVHRPACGCQSEVRLCGMGKGTFKPGEVRLGDCLQCTRERHARTGPLRLGIVSAGCYTGGAEFWMHSLLGSLDPGRFSRAGIAVVYPDHIDAGMRTQLETLCPVAIGTDAIDRLWQASDVVLIWGVPPWGQRMPPRPRHARAILVSHGVGPWTVPVFSDADSADGWAAVSTAALDPIPASHKTRAVVLPNGISLERITPADGARDRIRAGLGVSPSQRLAIYLGRVSDEKNPRAFIDMAAECERRWPGRFAFAVVGQGLAWESHHAHAARHAPHVSWPGVQRNVGDWLAAADHVVMPSHEEADSLTLLESMAAGVPVVSTRVGRLREAEYAALARVVEVDPSAATLADALELDATDPGVAARVASARALVRSRHSAEAMAGRWMDYLEGVTRSTRLAVPA